MEMMEVQNVDVEQKEVLSVLWRRHEAAKVVGVRKHRCSLVESGYGNLACVRTVVSELGDFAPAETPISP